MVSGGLGWISGESSTEGGLNRLPGAVGTAPSLPQFKVSVNNILRHTVGFWSCSVQGFNSILVVPSSSGQSMVLCPRQDPLLGLRNLRAHSGSANAPEAAPVSREHSWGGINHTTAKFDENSKAFRKLQSCLLQ